MPSRLEPIDRGTCGRAAATIQITHLPGLCIVNQPKRIATDASHVWVQHRKRGTGGNRSIHRRTARAQHIDARL